MSLASDEVTNYKIAFNNETEVEEFAKYIRDAVVERIAISEKFSAIRLAGIPMHYKSLLHGNLFGMTWDDKIEVGGTGRKSALQMAGAVIHELGHALVGVSQDHNDHWKAGCEMLGLKSAKPKQNFEVEDFDGTALSVIEAAIKCFIKEYPNLVSNADIEIPWPAGIGIHSCPNEHEAYGPCSEHWCHILKFQIEGIRDGLQKMSNGYNWLLADVMGLGKTVQVMGIINAMHPKRIFIGCPNNAKLVWKRHFERFCVHDYSDNFEVAGTALYMLSDVTIMNYEAMVKYAEMLKIRDDDLIIFDEGHYLKTPSAKRSKAAYGMHAGKVIIVTGTPIVNYPYELFPLIHYLDRKNWPEYGRFESQFGSRSSEKLGRNLNRLNDMLRKTIMTRRSEHDVDLQLPRFRRQVVEFEVSDEIRKLINAEMGLFNQLKGNAKDESEAVRFWNILKNESDIADNDLDFQVIIEELKLTKRFAFEEMAKIAHAIGLAKLPFAIDFIENTIESRGKVLVFGHHRDVLTKIAEKFAPSSVLLLGGNKDQALKTAQVSERFNTDPNCMVMCAQIENAQSYSVQGTSSVIFVEENWVPGIMSQAEKRVHGIGRGEVGAKSLMVWHLCFENSLDTYKAKLTIKKQKSIDRATGSNRV